MDIGTFVMVVAVAFGAFVTGRNIERRQYRQAWIKAFRHMDEVSARLKAEEQEAIRRDVDDFFDDMED